MKAGPATALFGLARELLGEQGVRVSVTTKAARGFGLAANAKAQAVKADNVELSPDMTVAAAEAAIIRS